MLKIRNILKSKGTFVWSISPGATAYEALELMAAKDVGALLVLEEGQLVGIFSERDYARKVILKGKTSRETLIEDLMTRNVYSVTPDESIEMSMALMTAKRCRHLPVLHEGKIAGMVSMGDLVNAIISDQSDRIRDLENYISGGYYMSQPD